MKIHPIADAIPMDPRHVEVLAADIKVNGLAQPILVDRDGVLLDGRHRLKACELAGVDVRTEIYEGDDPLEVVLSANLTRRELTKGQRAALALEILPEYEARAKQRQREHGGTAPGRENTPGKNVGSESGEAVAAAAARVGASATYVKRVRALRELDVEAFEEVLAGRKNLAEAERGSSAFRKFRKKTEAERRKKERERSEAAQKERAGPKPTVGLFLVRERGADYDLKVVARHVKPGGVVLRRGRDYGDSVYVVASEPKIEERSGRTVHVRHEALSWRTHTVSTGVGKSYGVECVFDGGPVETVLEGYLRHPDDPLPENLLARLVETFCPHGGVVAEYQPEDDVLESAARSVGREFLALGVPARRRKKEVGR